MSIIDFNSLKTQSPLGQFSVGFLGFKETERLFEIFGQRAVIANGTGVNLPEGESQNIKSDEIVFDRQGLEHFRYALLNITERLAKDDPSAWRAPDPSSRKESDFIRPIFNGVLERGVTMWEMLREIRTTELPIPSEFLIFLPPVDAKNPGRDDVIRTLVPFKQAQREVLKAGWNDERLSAFHITQKASQPKLLT